MALNAYPFESANTTEDQYTLLFRNFADTGIVGNYGDGQFKVSTDGSGLDVQVAAGYAIIRGHAVQNDAPVTVNIDAADSQFPRIDRLVLRLNPDADGIVLHVIKGTPNANPVAPPVVQTDVDIWDFSLASITVPANALNIVNDNISDRRRWGSHRFGVWTTATRPVTPFVGQPGFNIDIVGAEVWSGTRWESVNAKKVLRIPHTFTLAGPVVIASGDDYYVPPFIVPVPTGQTVRLKGVRHFLRTNSGEVAYEIRVNGTVAHSGTVTATATGTSTLDVNITNNAPVQFIVTGITGSPKNLTCSLFFDYEV